MRIRLPRGASAGLDAVLVNTAGGIACGDRFAVEVEVQSGAMISLVTPAAEKVYRSDGAVAELSVNLSVRTGARLDWLPQETLLFDEARLVRRLDADVDEGASLTLFEAVVFGREAREERIENGLFEDRWRIRHGRRLVYADTLRLAGPVSDLLRKPSVANGARAFATMVHVAPDAEERLESTRELLSSVRGCEVAASAWNGLLAVRFCAMSIQSLRSVVIPFLIAFRGEPLPRVWLS
ncbi:urease accessory protein UreD [Microvirga sp. ACRRW]|uniref:urease accessory protein UreD n=1 Tax=Microvirga sp. ACRRW TaxID=2918205 RepID=UPI001EF6DE0B|nr:urease accessory protein UreD [Microvirga sp. ACRRW]MCG7391522.1 urease accessory protein UreD [Microvirga sp. ACRRW]